MFNSKGYFISPSKMNFDLKQSQYFIAKFLHPQKDDPISDHIYTIDKKEINGDILSEDKNAIYVSEKNINNKIIKKTIVAVIYKDGHHVLYSPISFAADILWELKQASDTSVTGSISNTAKKPDKQLEMTRTPATEKNQNKDSGISNQTQSSVNSPTLIPDSALKNNIDTLKKLTIEDFTKDVSKDQFIKKATDKTQRFTQYLKILYDKSADNEQKDKTIEQAITLFVDENAEVEVSSVIKEEGVKHYKIRKYLQHVKLVNYDKIEIEWTHVQYVSDVRKGQDGNYYGTVEFEQVFKGYRDAQLVYSDITRKTANVVMKTYEKNYEGKTTILWDVLLSNIGVVSTKSL
jgi:hypothetical protein